MKKYFIYLSIINILLLALVLPIRAQENRKIAQTGMKFLTTSLDARASGMARAVTAVYGNSSALFYNPAGMAGIEKSFDFSVGRVSFIADINYIYGTAAYVPGQGEWVSSGCLLYRWTMAILWEPCAPRTIRGL